MYIGVIFSLALVFIVLLAMAKTIKDKNKEDKKRK